ncbi:MAG: hypothetical protein FH748_03025 [Balneolaceae bacterium]|nr:hypothetical protein [Balneolaceae bacterium]
MPSSRDDIETYILGKLKSVFSEYPEPLTPQTTFKKIYSKIDLDLVDLGFVMDIEDEMEVEISPDDADAIDKGDIAGLIDFIEQKQQTSSSQ